MNNQSAVSSLANPQRGAVKHWVIGCLVFVILIVGLIVGGGYYAWKKVAFNTIDTTSKVDPSPSADREVLLPGKSGSYERVAFVDPDSREGDVVTSGSHKAVYEKPGSKSTISVQAIPSNEMDDARKAGRTAGMPVATTGDGSIDMGFSFAIPVGPKKMQMALWTKKNWTYLLHTTGTEVLEFAKEFSPSSDDGGDTKK